MNSKRQQVFDAWIDRMKTILVANGYNTDVGKNVFAWRTTEFTSDVLPGMSVRDVQTETEQKVGNRHDHKTTFEIVVIHAAGDGTAAFVRKMAADVIKAVGIDRTFGGLVFNTDPVSDEMSVEQEGKTVGGMKLRFACFYRTGNFNPYE